MATVRSVGPVTIRGDAGNFSVVDVSSATTVGAGSIASNGGSLVWMPTTEMIPGNPHRVEGTSGGVASGTFEPLVRHGRPSIATALRAHEGHVDPEKVFVGSTDSMPATRVGELNPVPTVDETLPAALWASIRSVDGSDPVVFVGEQALIDAPPFALGFPITARAGAKTAAVACPLPIPDVPALAGTVLILQFGVERRGEVVISDVFGTTIRDAPGAGPLAAAGPRPRGARAWTSRSGAERTAIVAAAVAWLGHSTRTRAETGRRLYEAVRKR